MARTLRPALIRGKPLPRLFFVTDPARTLDPEAVVLRLPRGAGVIYRAFGAVGATAQGRRLARLAHQRGIILLAGADPRLAAAIGADGVHLPERLAHRAEVLRNARPGWIVTAAAHSAIAIARARRAGADAVLISPVFASASPSAGRPFGSLKLAQLASGARLPVVALGGINVRTARKVGRSGVAGLAAVEAFEF